jgi:phospholipid transport system substrate-binding protein
MQAALAITRRVIVPHVDFERITRDAVGKPWAAASPAQRATVTAEFRTLLTHVVARLLATYEDEDFSIAPADSAKDPVVLRINVRQTRSPGETPMQPMFVSLHRAAGAWRIHELRAENVNLVRLYSANFAVVMEREGGIDGLAKALAERNARNVAPDTAASAPAAGAAPKPGPKPAPQRAPALPSAPWEASSVSP